VVLPEDLPVALDGLLQRMSYREARHLPVIEPVDGQIEALLKCWGPLGERHENEAVPFGQRQVVERKFLAIEAIPGLHRGGLQQLTLQAVAPAMVGTHDTGRGEAAGAAAAQRRPAMAAGVEEGACDVVLAAYHQDRLRVQIERDVAARLVEGAGAAYVDPVALPDLLEFALVVCRIKVVGRRQRFDGCRESGVTRITPYS